MTSSQRQNVGLDVQQLYATEADAVFAFVARMGISEVEDVVHDTFVTAMQRAHTYDATRPVRPWLLGIAFRVGVARLRKPTELAVSELPDVSGGEDLEQRTAARQALAVVQRVLGELSDELGTTFVQHELQGLSVAELARTLNVPPATVYSRIRLAREAFRAALQDHRGHPS